MARLLKQAEAKRLGLPGRVSLEPVSGEIGSRVSFRIAQIAVPQPGDKPRGPHLHGDFEECIYVLSGQGTMHAESGKYPVQPGDILLVPTGEKHMVAVIALTSAVSPAGGFRPGRRAGAGLAVGELPRTGRRRGPRTDAQGAGIGYSGGRTEARAFAV